MSLTHRIFAQAVRDLRRTPASEVEAAAKTLLAGLLRNTARHVPLCRPLAGLLEAAADGDPAAWASLPIMTAEDLARAGISALATEVPKGEEAFPGERSWTSLSTPIAGPLGLLADIADKAQWEALAHGADLDATGRLAAILPPSVVQERDLAEAFGPWCIDARRGRANRWPAGLDPRTTLAWLDNIRPSCLFADPRSLEALLAVAEPGRMAIDHILIWRPAQPSDLSDACRRVFGARLIEAIASDLCGFVAFPCTSGGFAPALETMLTEILDDAGRPCSPDQPGRLVATALYSYHRPIIRLDLGFRVVKKFVPTQGAPPTARSGFRLLR